MGPPPPPPRRSPPPEDPPPPSWPPPPGTPPPLLKAHWHFSGARCLPGTISNLHNPLTYCWTPFRFPAPPRFSTRHGWASNHFRPRRDAHCLCRRRHLAPTGTGRVRGAQRTICRVAVQWSRQREALDRIRHGLRQRLLSTPMAQPPPGSTTPGQRTAGDARPPYRDTLMELIPFPNHPCHLLHARHGWPWKSYDASLKSGFHLAEIVRRRRFGWRRRRGEGATTRRCTLTSSLAAGLLRRGCAPW